MPVRELTLSSQPGASIRYRIGTGAWTTYAEPVPLAEGTSTVELQATASDGALGLAQVVTAKVDATRPVAAASIDQDRKVTITAEDVLSGVSSIEYALGDGDWQVVDGPIALDQEAHVVTYRATDRAGNLSEVGELKVPGGPLDSVATAEVSNEGKDGWHGAGAKVTLTASDDGDAVRYRVDEGEWIDYDGPFALDEGLTLLEFQTVKGERLGVVGSAAVKVDATVPTVKASLGGDRQVTIVASDALSGIDASEYRIDGDEWLPYTAPFAVDGKAHTIEYRSTDVAGNVTDVKTLEVAAVPAIKPAPKATTCPRCQELRGSVGLSRPRTARGTSPA
ncbi:OmpL47-type beta-barrel domain-containing protein [Aeromicrobium sp. UC242_57]|uniref:OmpL47-type beta-barrel domain-containing protein n=1 Tax=Aeromicrobium sp. UC242_57 TaxID=3374624 RepID=UPI0037B0E120